MTKETSDRAQQIFWIISEKTNIFHGLYDTEIHLRHKHLNKGPLHIRTGNKNVEMCVCSVIGKLGRNEQFRQRKKTTLNHEVNVRTLIFNL